MERQIAIAVLNSIVLVLEAISRKHLGDARSALADSMVRVQGEPGIESQEKTALIAALREAEENLSSPGADGRAATAILERASRKLWNVIDRARTELG